MRSGAQGCGAIQVASQFCHPSPIMTGTLIDPRPMEPSWVSEVPSLDRADWIIRRRFWNKTTRKIDAVVESGSGNMLKMLSTLAAILNSRNIECEIEVYANNTERVNSERPLFIDLQFPSGYELGLYWSIEPILGGLEEGTCTDELFDWVEYLLNENKCFKIDLSYLDPTP